MACDRAFGTTPEASLIMTCISAPSTPAGLRPGHGAGGRCGTGLRRHGRFEGGHAQGGPGAIRLRLGLAIRRRRGAPGCPKDRKPGHTAAPDPPCCVATYGSTPTISNTRIAGRTTSKPGGDWWTGLRSPGSIPAAWPAVRPGPDGRFQRRRQSPPLLENSRK